MIQNMLIKVNDIKRAEEFSHLVMNMHRFTDSIIINFLDEGFYVQGMEQSQVCLFEVNLTKGYFDQYEKTEGDSPTIGLKTTILQKIFNSRDSDQTVEMKYDGDPDKIQISFESVKDSKSIPKFFEIPLIDVEQTNLSIPDKEYTAEVNVETKTFSSIVSNLLVFGEDIKVKCQEDEIWMSSSNFEGEMKVFLMDETENDYIIQYISEQGCDILLQFKSKYISNFCAFSKLAKNVWLYFIEDEPMQMKYEMGEESYVRFYLAPYNDNE